MIRGIAAAALVVATTPVQARTGGEMMLREWSRLPSVERQAMIVATVEGLLLAAASTTETVPRVDSQCVGTIPLTRIDEQLVQRSRARDAAFVDMFLEVSGCSRS